VASASAAKRTEKARIAAEKRDKFLRASGMIVGLQGGLSHLLNTNEQIFGEPKSTESPATSNGGSVGPVVALRLGKNFAIQSGVIFIINFKGPSKLEYTYLQVPMLVRCDWSQSLGGMGVGIFGGLAFNVPLSASSNAQFSTQGGSQTAAMTIPIGGIAGIEVSILQFGSFSLFMDAHYTLDFGETRVKLADGQHEGKFNRSSVDIIFGVKYYLPFRR
jgi:hypothetical protein